MMLAALVLQLAAPPSSPSEPVSRGPLASLVTADDYPAGARYRGESGTVRFRLDVDTAGRVHGCTILASSGASILDATTCRLMRARARFTPARDASGKSVPGSVESSIGWKLGPAAPPRLDAMMSIWVACASGEAARRTLSQADAAAVPGAAFAACADLEPRLLAEMERANVLKRVPAEDLKRLKQIVAERLEAQVRASRTQLEIGLPGK